MRTRPSIARSPNSAVMSISRSPGTPLTHRDGGVAGATAPADAFRRRQQAIFAVTAQFRDTGRPGDEVITEADSADAEWRAAEEEVDRIVQESPGGPAPITDAPSSGITAGIKMRCPPTRARAHKADRLNEAHATHWRVALTAGVGQVRWRYVPRIS
jgi:hypothetical protein